MRIAFSERGSVPSPPTSTTRSTPSPPVSSSAQRSQSGIVAVVQAGVQPQRVGPLQLLVAAADAQHPRPPQPRKLQRKDRNPARSLDQHRRSRLQTCPPPAHSTPSPPRRAAWPPPESSGAPATATSPVCFRTTYSASMPSMSPPSAPARLAPRSARRPASSA